MIILRINGPNFLQCTQ